MHMKLSQFQLQKNGVLIADRDVQLGKDWVPDGHGCIEVVQDKSPWLVEGKFWYDHEIVTWQDNIKNIAGWMYKAQDGRMVWILIVPDVI